ncbi:MAG: hypothetical protein ACSHX8_13255 [Opitutaceae bacterium]
MQTLHLMSDGRVEVIGSYRLHEASKLGEEEDRIFHIIQKNRKDGSRLYWSCLVNVDSMQLQVIYPISDFTTPVNIKEYNRIEGDNSE